MEAFLLLLLIFIHPCLSRTVVIDTIPHRNTTLVNVSINDTLLFKHAGHRDVYIFHSRRALHLCNLSRAALLHSHRSSLPSFTWRPHSCGNFYFSFGANCTRGGKLVVTVAEAGSSTTHHRAALAPLHSTVIATLPHDQSDNNPPPGLGRGVPFVSSDPALPIPTPESGDSATIHPLPATGGGSARAMGPEGKKMMAVLVATIITVTFALPRN